jgi:hypothetical protein
MSILRLWTVVDNDQNSIGLMDFTWWYPLTLIISCIELDFAIICGSMPIFWPQLTVYLAQIFVTNEVHVTHHERLDDDERNHRGIEYEMDGAQSWKSNSEENLTRAASLGKSNKTDYTDRLVIDYVTGKVQERTKITVEPVQKNDWRGYK